RPGMGRTPAWPLRSPRRALDSDGVPDASNSAGPRSPMRTRSTRMDNGCGERLHADDPVRHQWGHGGRRAARRPGAVSVYALAAPGLREARPSRRSTAGATIDRLVRGRSMADLAAFRAEARGWLEKNAPQEVRGIEIDPETGGNWGGRRPR